MLHILKLYLVSYLESLQRRLTEVIKHVTYKCNKMNIQETYIQTQTQIQS